PPEPGIAARTIISQRARNDVAPASGAAIFSGGVRCACRTASRSGCRCPPAADNRQGRAYDGSRSRTMSEPVLQSTRPSAQATAAQASRAGAGRRRVPDPGAAATRMPRLEAVRMELPVLLATQPDLPGAQDPDYLLRALARQLNLPGEGAGITWS